MYFEVEIVLLRTFMVKRNAGRGTPAKILFKTALFSGRFFVFFRLYLTIYKFFSIIYI